MAVALDTTVSSILAQANSKNSGLALTLAEVMFSQPRVKDDTWQGETLSGNTLIRITPNANSKYTGSVVVGYDRVNMSVLHGLLGGIIRAGDEVTDVTGAMIYIANVYGIAAQATDFEPANITTDGDGKRWLVLKATANAVGWLGEATFEIKPAPVSMTSVVTQTVLDGYKYITDSDKGFAETYSYPLDFTGVFAQLSTVTTQTSDLSPVATALQTITGDTWSATEAAPFSLYGATVLFAGINADMQQPTNKAYKYAIVIALSASCGSLEGNLILHFNDPIEAIDPDYV